MRCIFCFYLTNKSFEPINCPSNLNAELSLREIEKISFSMKKLLWLAFSGGEIFLREDIVDITDIFYRNNKPVIICFPTNGKLTSVIKEKVKEILHRCKKSVIVVKLSIDGTESIHDSLRGKGSFQGVMNTYQALKGFIGRFPNFELGINTLFCTANQDSMDEIIKLVNGLEGIKTHTISLIRGEVSDKRLKEIDTVKYYETISKLETNLKNKKASIYRFRGARIKAAQDILQRRLIYKTIIHNKKLIPCYAGRLSLVLRENGDVYPCEILTERFGNVRNYGYNIRKIIQSEKAKKIINSTIKHQCYCTHECNFMINILFNPFVYFALLRKYLKL